MVRCNGMLAGARYRGLMRIAGTRNWKRSSPSDAEEWLAEVDSQWWIAGGWALDLYRGQPTREHSDLDVGCFRQDLPNIRAALRGWMVCAAHDGHLSPLRPDEEPRPDVNSVWCRPADAEEWWLELLLDERQGQDWVFRRCADVRRPAHAIALTSKCGPAYLRPELQLLYKSKNRRPKDDADFDSIRPLLGQAARRWLSDALGSIEPDHPWREKLRFAG